MQKFSRDDRLRSEYYYSKGEVASLWGHGWRHDVLNRAHVSWCGEYVTRKELYLIIDALTPDRHIEIQCHGCEQSLTVRKEA